MVGIFWTIQLSRMLTIEKLDVGLDRFQIIGRIGLNDSANTFSPAQGYSGFFRIKLVALEFFFPFLLDNLFYRCLHSEVKENFVRSIFEIFYREIAFASATDLRMTF